MYTNLFFYFDLNHFFLRFDFIYIFPFLVPVFLKRNHELSQLFAANIKRNRAAVGADTLAEYIQNLEEAVKDVPPENIWNYDETNLSDDLGHKRILTKRGTKYPEVKRDSSKSSTSFMFAGNAEGQLLPPYVVYKSKQLWNTWTEHGQKMLSKL